MSPPLRPEVAAAAWAARGAGISVVPPMEDGTKRPDGAWKRYQVTPATDDQVRTWYGRHTGLGFVTGAVSGGLQLFELDADFYAEFKATAQAVGLGPLLERIEAGYLERSPGGGWHLLYRCTVVKGNTKLAQKPGPIDPETGKPTTEVLIETRGEGGYVVVAPSNGKVHPSGGQYQLDRGGVESIATITGGEQDQLWALAKTFDQMPVEEGKGPLGGKKPIGAARPAGPTGHGEVRTGDDYNARMTWDDVIGGRGWTKLYARRETTYWRRPGKSEGWSATTNHNGSGLLWVFTTSSEFEAERSYDKFGAYATIEHRGSFESATKSLGDQGYGTFLGRVWDDEAGQWGEPEALQKPCPKGGKTRIVKDGERVPPPPKGCRAGGRKGGGPPPVEAATAQEPPIKRPEIEINTEWHKVVVAGIEALRADPDLYSRGDALVNVVQEEDDELRISTRLTIKGIAGSPKVITISDSNIGCRLTEFSSLYSWKPDKAGELIAVSVRPPDWMIKAIATRKHYPGIRRLEAVVECPFPRPDGSIVEAKGYDRATATLFLPSIDFSQVPERPDREAARVAWDRIKAYVREFPFATEDDRVIYLAGLLTVIARPAIVGPVPGIAVIGNKAGTGKGLLIDAMTIPGTGRPCPTSTYPDSKEEATKVKVSIAKAAKVAVHFDNLEDGSSYGSGPLDSALTSTVADERQLGTNDSPPLPLRPAWFLSGNNVYPCKDAYRRWLVCNLKTELERPEERTDIEQKVLRAVILENRGPIVRDVLTILRAHTLAGRPQPDWPGFGSFEDWDLVVRGAVWFATDRDCLTTQRQAAADSPDRADKIALLEGLWELPEAKTGRRGVTSDEAVKLVESKTNEYETLRRALVARGRGGKPATSNQLGYILRSMVGSPIGGFKLLKHPILRHKVVAWVVEHTEDPQGGDGGIRGDDFGTPTRDFDDDSHTNTCRKNSESLMDRPDRSPPIPPSPPLSKEERRAAVRRWPDQWQQRYADLAGQLSESGHKFPSDEIEAFARIVAEMDEIRKQPTSGWD